MAGFLDVCTITLSVQHFCTSWERLWSYGRSGALCAVAHPSCCTRTPQGFGGGGSRAILCCRTDKLEPLGEALPILEFARAETRKRAPHLTHPLLCLDAIRTGVEQGGHAGLQQASLPLTWLSADAPIPS